MMKVETRNPHDGMSFKSLGEPSAASAVPVTDQEKSCNSSPRVDFLFAGIDEILKDLFLAKDKLHALDFRAFDLEMFKSRSRISSLILDAAIELFHLSQDIKSVYIQRIMNQMREVSNV
ncbi:hypothetical protein [Xylella fastidiosa]|uniref:hypothetical protein n=1 Tax=Xylella fastidiosa TaxID=2371 RepID=UPI000765E845|nr:hypothetical protein [Xylella fastidiosa]KXB19704.1 hypothetical protein ADT30_08870 [Xylella fastidiosa]